MNERATYRTPGIVTDPSGSIEPDKDTTLALMLAAQKRGRARRNEDDCLEGLSAPAHAPPGMAGPACHRAMPSRQGGLR